MQKIACIFSFKESNWVSCQKIVFNLHKSYQACPRTVLENFNYPHEISDMEQVLELANQIAEFNPDVISIMDHKPHPLPLLSALAKVYEGKTKPKLIIHLFGDFTLNYIQWEKAASALKAFKVEFLAASKRQKILIDRMLGQKHSITCPFPVDPNEFHVDESLRTQQRKEWKVSDEDRVFLFTGRLSRQKRIKTLLSQFAQVFKDEPRARLYIYGNADNIGDPFLGIHDIEGEYFRSFYSLYKSFAPELQKRIQFMGAVPNSELKKVYQGADVLVNLSVHNDEDYGMSVAESQMSGLPAILTDWGGLAGFEHSHIPEATSFVPVKIGQRAKLISRGAVRESLSHYFKHPSQHLRIDIATAANSKFGLKAVTEILGNVLNKDTPVFEDFSELFYRISKRQKVIPTEQLYVTKYYKINQLYREIYSAYVR